MSFLDTGKTLGRHDGRTGQNLESWHDADSGVKNNIFCWICAGVCSIVCPKENKRQTDEIG